MFQNLRRKKQRAIPDYEYVIVVCLQAMYFLSQLCFQGEMVLSPGTNSGIDYVIMAVELKVKWFGYVRLKGYVHTMLALRVSNTRT